MTAHSAFHRHHAQTKRDLGTSSERCPETSQRGRRWTQPEHVEAAGTAEFRLGTGQTGLGQPGTGGTRARSRGGVEPNETVPNTTDAGGSGRDPNRTHERRERSFDLPPVQHPPGDCVGENPAVTRSRALCCVSFLAYEQQPRSDWHQRLSIVTAGTHEGTKVRNFMCM